MNDRGGTLVAVGNCHQPFHRLLDMVALLAQDLPQPVCVQFGRASFSYPEWECAPFFDNDSFSARLRNAEVVIAHAGAGLVLQALENGKRPIVCPRRAVHGEHIDDHQVEFATAMAGANRVVWAETKEAMRRALGNPVRFSSIAGGATTTPSAAIAEVAHVLGRWGMPK